MKTFQLPIARDYVRDWGVVAAVMELVQNAIDSDSPFNYSFVETPEDTTRLILRSEFSALDPRTLVLGTTSKADANDKIGTFGEGYKLALLVLARNDRDTFVYNSGRVWTAGFELSEHFGVEVLTIYEGVSACIGLTFEINSLTHDEVLEIKSRCLLMQDTDPELLEGVTEVPQGFILPHLPGRLYCGGLFVSTTELNYGYNIKPEFLELERDRKTVDGFKLCWLLKDMWVATKQFELVAQMVLDDVPDVKYVQHNCPELLRQACYDTFMERNPEGVCASSPAELKRLVDAGMTKVVYQNEQTHAIVSKHSSYAPTAARVRMPNPVDELQAWYNDNKKYMSRLPQVSLKKLIDKAAKWKNS